METNLYKIINKANAARDVRAIKTLGPYARVLYFSVSYPPLSNEKEQAKVVKDETERRVDRGQKVRITKFDFKVRGEKIRLYVHKGDNPHEVAVEFCKKHGLNEQKRI